MNSLTKWMLVLALVVVSGTAIAAQQPNKFESAAGNLGCRAPVHCVPAVKPNLKPHAPPHVTPPPPHVAAPPPHVTPPPPHVTPPPPPPPVGNTNNATGSGGTTGGNGPPSPPSPPQTFTCGEVVGGVTVGCNTTTPPPPKSPVSAPEIDASGAVNGTVLVLGCLAILHARRRRLATLTGR